MACREWENLISEYLDGELPSQEKSRVEQHLFECRECSEHFRALKDDDDAAAAAFEGLPAGNPEEFAASVMAKIRKATRPRRHVRWIAAAVAASLVCAFVAYELVIGISGSVGKVARLTDRAGIASVGIAKSGAAFEAGGKARRATLNGRIRPGDTIVTSDDCLAYLKLNTGDEVVVNHDSKVTFARKDGAHRQVLVVQTGEVFVRAEKNANPLCVQTSAGTAEVVGTQFSVSFDPVSAQAALVVREGKVRFRNSRGEQLVGAGYQSMASAGAGPSEARTVDAAALTAWVDPPSPAKVQQVAQDAVRNLQARVVAAKDVFEAGEPIAATIELVNSGREPVQVSRGMFVGREDTAVQRANYKLSQVMVTKVFGTELAVQAAKLPQPLLAELKPGEVLRSTVDLSAPGDCPALRVVRGAGAYSVSATFAVARALPGAADESLVWADVHSQPTIVRVMSSATPVEGKAVAGLELGFSAKMPGCRLGKDLGVQFSLKGVTSDQITVSAGGAFRLKIEPTTFGALAVQPAQEETLRKLDAKFGELKIEQKPMTPRELLGVLAGSQELNVLADRAALKDEAMAPAPARTLRENIEAIACSATGSLEAGRTAVWVMNKPASTSNDIGRSLAGVAGVKDNWIKLNGVDHRDGSLTLPTGRENFPRPGLYRCTVEYSNRETKVGPDWPGAWLGSIKSSPIVVAILEPQPPERADGDALSISIADAATDGRTANLSVELKNISNKEIGLTLAECIAVRDELLVYDILNPDCFDRSDADVLKALDVPISLSAENIEAASLLATLAEHTGSFEGLELLKGRSLLALAKRISVGEVLEYLARDGNVSFMRSGRRQFIIAGDQRLPEPREIKPQLAGPAAVTIPAHGSRTVRLTATVPDGGSHRLQVQYIHTGAKPGEEQFWSGSAASNTVTVEAE